MKKQKRKKKKTNKTQQYTTTILRCCIFDNFQITKNNQRIFKICNVNT